MRITDIVTFDEYWSDQRFQAKKPVMNGSLEQRFGDNIYHSNGKGGWNQADSRHSWDGTSNDVNLKRDTGTTDRVLVANDFIYWGENAPKIPPHLSKFVIARPGWKDDFTDTEVDDFVKWARATGSGLLGDPLEWRYERWWR